MNEETFQNEQNLTNSPPPGEENEEYSSASPDEEAEISQQPADSNLDIIPIQKFFLIQKLQQLRIVLINKNHPAEAALETILNFSQFLSYETLLLLTYKLLSLLTSNNSDSTEIGMQSN